MRAVLQRATHGQVRVGGQVVGRLESPGVVALVAVHVDDGPAQVGAMAAKIADLRILPGEISLVEADAPVLLISQFTLYGSTRKGRRPSWSAAASGEVAEPLIDDLGQALRARGLTVATGVFGAHMSVEITNDGPFTVLVDV